MRTGLIFVLFVLLASTSFALSNPYSEPFQTGEMGSVSVTVKNVGSALGSFLAYVTCTDGFTQKGNAVPIQLEPGEEGTVTIPITCGTSVELHGTCTLTVYDYNSPNNRDEIDVSVTCLPIVLCTAGTKKCSGNLIVQCSESGSGYDTIIECEHGCIIDGLTGQPKCASASKPKQEENDNGAAILVVIISVVIIIVAIGLVFAVRRR